MRVVLDLRVVLIALTIFLTACGGGSGSSSGRTNTGGGNTGNSSYSAFDGGFESMAGALPSNNASMLGCSTFLPADPSSTIVGRVQFERVPLASAGGGLDYSSRFLSPARGIVVEAVTGSGSQCSENVIARTLTDINGDYGLNVNINTPVCIQARAQVFRSSGSGPSYDFQVTDNTNGNAPYYLVDNRLLSSSEVGGAVRNLTALSGFNDAQNSYTDPRAAGPFAILDSFCDSLDTIIGADTNIDLPTLSIRWSPDNNLSDGDIEDGDVGGSFFRLVRGFNSQGAVVREAHEIVLVGDEDSDTDEYDPHVLVHESAHYIQEALSRSDSLGGSHGIGDRLDMSVAFEEGLANAYSGMALDGVIPTADTYHDTFGSNQASGFRLPLDQNRTRYINSSLGVGWYSEASVHKIIYDVYDADNSNSADSVTLPFVAIYNAWMALADNDAVNTLFSFLHELIEDNPGSTSGINALAANEAVETTGLDEFGSTEVLANNQSFEIAGDSLDFQTDITEAADDIIPVYIPLTLGVPQQACSNPEFGLSNSLGNIRYLTVDIPSADNYRITATAVGGLTSGGTAVLELYRRGSFIDDAIAPFGSSTAEISTLLNPGIHVIYLYDEDIGLDTGVPTQRRCFNVSVN